jgi:hypothetical protein
MDGMNIISVQRLWQNSTQQNAQKLHFHEALSTSVTIHSTLHSSERVLDF